MESDASDSPQTDNRKVLDDFRDSLAAEEALVLAALAKDELGILLRAAINEFDWFYFNFRRMDEPDTRLEEQFYILQLGVNRMIKLALESRPSFDVPIVMFPRDKELATQARGFLRGLGFIEHGRRVADSVTTGLGAIRKVRDSYFEFDIPRTVVDDEYHERGLKQYYQVETQRWIRSLENPKHEMKVLGRVDSLLAENVRVFNVHFIGYESDPFLDDHFFMEGYKKLHLQEGFDTFHYSLEFGGVRFQKYILALAYFIGLALKHESFCLALTRKVPDIRLYNTLTISCDRKPFIDDMHRALNSFGMMFEGFTRTTETDAETIFKVLSVGRGRTDLLSRPAAALTSIIQVSDTGFIRSVAGAQLSPVSFLLLSLRTKFPADYDRNQRTRENSMQRAMKRVLSDRFQGLVYRQNIRLKRDGKDLTDVDFMFADPSLGTIVLCQLKSQELYGADIRAEGTRTGRLNNEISKWITSVRGWINSTHVVRIRSTFRLNKSFEVKQIFYLTISRHYAHSLKAIALGENAAFATWLQFVNAIELMRQQQGDFKTLPGLVRLLMKQNFDVPDGLHLEDEDTLYKLATVAFGVRRVG